MKQHLFNLEIFNQDNFKNYFLESTLQKETKSLLKYIKLNSL